MRIVRLHPVTHQGRERYMVPAVAVEWIQGMEVENQPNGNFYCTIVYTPKGYHRVKETPEEIEALLNSDERAISAAGLLRFAHWLQDNPFPIGKAISDHINVYLREKTLGGGR